MYCIIGEVLSGPHRDYRSAVTFQSVLKTKWKEKQSDSGRAHRAPRKVSSVNSRALKKKLYKIPAFPASSHGYSSISLCQRELSQSAISYD